MIATDFCFDGLYLSDFDCIIVNFDNNEDSVSGGATEYDAIKAPDSDKFRFYGSQFNTVLTWNLSIGKNPCKANTYNEQFFTHEDERKISKWLVRTDGYKWFNFIERKTKVPNNHYFGLSVGKAINVDSSDTKFQVKIDRVPHKIAGNLVGFDLTITANCAYGFTDPITKMGTINSNTSLAFNVDTDAKEYILPEKFKISNIVQTNTFNIENEYDSQRRISLNKATSFQGLNFSKNNDSTAASLIFSPLESGDTTKYRIQSYANIDLVGTGGYLSLGEVYDYVTLTITNSQTSSEISKIFTHGVTLCFTDEHYKILRTEVIDFKKQAELELFYETKDYSYIALCCDYSQSAVVSISFRSYSIDFSKQTKKYSYSKNRTFDLFLSGSTTRKIDVVVGIFMFDKNDKMLRNNIYINPSPIEIKKETVDDNYYIICNMWFKTKDYIAVSYIGTSTEYTTSLKTPLELNCEDGVITGLDNPNHFNWYFPRLVDGDNKISTDSENDIDIEITYREARMVME